MIIYYTEDFKRVLNNPSSYINISKFRVIAEKELENFKELTSDEINMLSYSPSGGYYKAEGIILDSLLTLSIEIPSSDISINDYTALLIYYENVLNYNEPPRLAFIISGSMNKKDSTTLELGKLNLEASRTIINITKFNYNCSIYLDQTQDLEFLEGKGVGKINTLYLNIDKSEKSLRYVSRDSYESYLHELRSTDDYSHLHTTFINNYGLKVY